MSAAAEKTGKDVDAEVEAFKLDLRAACNKIMDNFTKYKLFVGHSNADGKHTIMFLSKNNGSLHLSGLSMRRSRHQGDLGSRGPSFPFLHVHRQLRKMKNTISTAFYFPFSIGSKKARKGP